MGFSRAELADLKEELARLKGQLKAANRAPRPPQPASPPSPSPLAGNGRANSKSRDILKKLEEPIPMSFAKPTPLVDVLKYIKSATQGPDDTGIPIYVDPVGLSEAEKTITAPVKLDLEGVALKTTLRLILQQLGLTYVVKDGLLTITSEASESLNQVPVLEVVEQARRGELSIAEIQEMTALLKAIAELEKAASSIAPQVVEVPEQPE